MLKRSLVLLLSLAVAASLFAASAADFAAQGRAAFDRQEWDKAVELFQKAITLDPKNAEHHYLLGATYGQQAQRAGMFSAAGLAKKTKAELERAVELDPNYVDARLALIDYYMIAPGFMGGSIEKAKEHAAFVRKQDDIMGRRATARIYLREKKNDLATKEYVEMVRAHPQSAKAHYFLGAFLLSEKNYAGALHELELAVKLDAAFMPSYYRLGQHAATSQSNYARGEEALKKYLAYKPKDNEPALEWAWYWLGMVYEKQGKKAEARSSYLNAQKLAPKAKDISEALKRVS
jgi:tetratricopeptide (TPR) repeat protein